MKLDDKILVICVTFFILLCVYTALACYQHSRYRPYDLMKHPVWDDAKKRWVGDGFTCYDFTTEAIDWFNSIGVKAYRVIGYDKVTGEGHSWVGIDCFGNILHYEPQSLMFFDPSDEYKDITVNYNR